VSSTASPPPPAKAGWLFFFKNAATGEKFLVNTGSSYSILPYRSTRKPYGPALRATNRRSIKCWRSRLHSLQLNNCKYQWNFLRTTEGRFPILQIDFLRHFDLQVDVSREQLMPRHIRPLSSPPRPALRATCGKSSSIAPPPAAIRRQASHHRCGRRLWTNFPQLHSLLWRAACQHTALSTTSSLRGRPRQSFTG
jgi:hypothetical protein